MKNHDFHEKCRHQDVCLCLMGFGEVNFSIFHVGDVDLQIWRCAHVRKRLQKVQHAHRRACAAVARGEEVDRVANDFFKVEIKFRCIFNIFTWAT